MSLPCEDRRVMEEPAKLDDDGLLRRSSCVGILHTELKEWNISEALIKLNRNIDNVHIFLFI